MEIKWINPKERWIIIGDVHFRATCTVFDNAYYCRWEIKQFFWHKGLPVWKSDTHCVEDIDAAFLQAVNRLQMTSAPVQAELFV